MAATKRNAMLIEEARSKIRTTQLINRLQDHALGVVEMTPTQVQATTVLLKKCVPDLAAVTLSGDAENPIRNEHTIRDFRAELANRYADCTDTPGEPAQADAPAVPSVVH